MLKHAIAVSLIALGCCDLSLALEPNEVLVIANADCAPSMQLARYYCQKRGVPADHIVSVSLGPQVRDSLSRDDYDARLAGPVRSILATRRDLQQIQCLVTTYGVPYKVGRREPMTGMESQLNQLRQSLQQEKDAMAQLESAGSANSPLHQQRQIRIAQLQMDMDRIMGKETDASVDSELSLLLCPGYDLYRWQPNWRRSPNPQPFKTLMASRLDGPHYGIAKGLIDKALAAEEKGLTGVAYIDSRGLSSKDMYGYYDQSLRDLAVMTRLRTSLTAQEETTSALFPPESCPRAALYCGWYSLKKYVDSFQFIDGAVGYHIASFEAADLHDPNSSEWCPALLMHGITATLGPITEPYLPAFPEPKLFFSELFDGRCLVEAYYRTAPFTSWRMILIGDPLYRPFKPHAGPVVAPEGTAAPQVANPAPPAAGKR
jgi:uncharacterized protein (TIGR03790 family)